MVGRHGTPGRCEKFKLILDLYIINNTLKKRFKKSSGKCVKCAIIGLKLTATNTACKRRVLCWLLTPRYDETEKNCFRSV